MENVMAILLIAGLVLLLLLIRFVVHAAVNKAGDSIRNACVRSRERSTPPRRQRLADRCAPSEADYGRRA